jgi:hypothetical protein
MANDTRLADLRGKVQSAKLSEEELAEAIKLLRADRYRAVELAKVKKARKKKVAEEPVNE